MSAIKRDDAVYKEIEAFEDYELSNNVAYEMMIRNDEFIKDRLDLINSSPDISEIFMDNIKCKAINNIIKLNSNYIKKSLLEKTNKPKILEEIENVEIEEALNSKIFSDIASLLEEKWGVIFHIILNCYNLENINFDNNNLILNGKDLCDYQSNYKITNKDYMHTKFNLSFSRPKLEIKNISKVAEIKLNLSLPKDELIAIISKIKDEADAGNIKNPIELLGTELEKAGDIKNMCSENKNGNLKCFDKRKGATVKQKIADMFFIYDSIKIGKKKQDIIRDVDAYYDPERNKKIGFNPNTYDKYLLIAKDYIDNKKYKELVTGVKQP